MNKRSVFFLLFLSIVLSGCRLAAPNSAATENDALVGVFITDGSIAEPDYDALAQSLLNGQSPVGSWDGRIYAAHVETQNGDVTTGTYEFPDLEGSLLASFLMPARDNGDQPYWASTVTGDIGDVSARHYARDDGYDLGLSGTVWLTAGGAEKILYFNPVYQTASGQVYLCQGEGMAFGREQGVSASQTLKSTATVTENGVSTHSATEITLTLEIADPANFVRILHMDKNSNILQQQEFSPENFPREVSPTDGAAYLIIEEETAGGTRRSLSQPGENSFSCFFDGENGFCQKHSIQVLWP